MEGAGNNYAIRLQTPHVTRIVSGGALSDLLNAPKVKATQSANRMAFEFVEVAIDLSARTVRQQPIGRVGLCHGRVGSARLNIEQEQRNG